MMRAALIRTLMVALAFAPVVRATCDVTCIEPPAAVPCHQPASQPDTPDDRWSHDHDGHAARVACAAPFAAVLPAGVTFTPRPASIDVDVDRPRALAPRGSPIIVLRV